ncbi:C2 calcium-dependent domain-containing protein 4C-like [Bombina bombina]|uniref:C2 calcium-dependent domain-containing protein 4C-like n=1 Tax=Bombina bombina TaxID=8345 RepID=UPI00235AECAC|nr:C2 calcium-dependent domain-containing protein 4C-like [Bombina bombina]
MVGREQPQHRIPTCPNVITPDCIPEFCIPPKHTSQQRLSTHHRHVYDLCSPSFEVAVKETHLIQVDSVDDPPEEESTNGDPQSQAALSLPHLPKAQTSYGFSTLLESPNTRRKESLFHNDPNNLPSLLPLPNSQATHYLGGYSPCRLTSPNLQPLSRSTTFDSDTASSTDSSPFSSPLLHRSLPSSLLKALNQEKKNARTLKVNYKFYNLRHNSISTDEDSSTDSSPCVTRRASSEGALMPATHSPMSLLLSFSQFPLDGIVPLDTGGILRISSEYCLETERLRIRLVSAEGLYKPSVDAQNISSYISLSLGPGKNQKQRSTLIRGSRNPIFNEDFFFERVGPQDIMQKYLKFKAINKGSSIWRDSVLGKKKLCLLNVLPV